jgi:D-alanyl-D-alanine carboxypeptidase (penicillin-binding protein 5/6)
VEAESNRVLYEYHSDTRMPMASTTKIVTAISVLESEIDLSKKIKIPSAAVGIEGSSAYLKEQDEYSIEDLLYGLMLRSGNDCAVALALEVDGSIEKFASRMNKTAERAGALESNFTNPHGLPKSKHYTTAKDLSLITTYALQNKEFSKIVSTKYYKPRGWKNKNKLLNIYEGAIGVKTGYTKEAGRCLVSAAERNGLKLVCTVLNRSDTYERSITLFDDFFAAYHKEDILKEGDTFMIEKDGQKLNCETHDNFSYPLLESENSYIEKIITPYNTPLNKEIVGKIEIFLLKRLLFCGFLYKL